MTTPVDHAYRGARALVALHEEHMRVFLATWHRAEERAVPLPESEDPDYASRPALLRHVLGCAPGYMRWMCEKLDLPDPGFRTVPAPDRIADEADVYLEHVLERWRTPLRDVPGERFEETYASSWGTLYSLDAMLEHAVMHPIRHRFQLAELLGA